MCEIKKVFYLSAKLGANISSVSELKTANESSSLAKLKGLSHEKLQGSKVVSIDRSSFNLFLEKVSQIFIRPPSCVLHKTVHRHII